MPPVLETVVVVGTRTTVGCRGVDCTSVVSAMRELPPLFIPSWEDQIEPDTSLDYREFCDRLDRARPAGCGLYPRPTPGLDLSWRPNGCGVGGLTNVLATAALEVYSAIDGIPFSGDLDEPYPGRSFLAACNDHDRCWAAGESRISCDENFRVATVQACGGVADCERYARTYHYGVSRTSTSDETYAASIATRRCAVWHRDMNDNECRYGQGSW